jgi:type IV conjugative transfer system protein TraE
MRWERYLTGKVEHGLLKFVILMLALGLVMEGFFVVKFSQDQRVVLVPPLKEKAWVSEQEASPEYLEQMAFFLLPLAVNFHPANLEERIPLFLQHVAPEQYGEVKAQFVSQAERAQRNDLSQVFYVQRTEVKDQTVKATGILRRFVGKTQVTEEVTTYEIRFEIRHGRPVVVGIGNVPGSGPGHSNRQRP